MDDRELLRDYLAHQFEPAFTELVRRHMDLVYATALRTVRDPALAQDVVQAVFLRLARKAWTVRDGAALPAWLYRAAYHAACTAVRSEARRRHHETEAMKHGELDNETPAVWEQLRPLLDEALHRLNRAEQNAVMLRFFEGQSLQELGVSLGTTEAAAHMRVNRAVEKLRRYFARAGVTVGATALASTLTAHACQAAPAGLAAGVAQASLAGAAGTGGLSSLLGKILFMTTKTKTVLTVLVVAAVAAVPLEIQRERINQLQAELAGVATRAPAHAAAPRNVRPGASAALPQSLAWNLNGSLAEILKKYSGGARIPAFVKLIEQTPVADLAQLLNEAALCPDAGARELLEKLIYAKWVAAEPAGALAYAKIDALRGNPAALDRVFDEWAGLDPQHALAAALQLDRFSWRTAALTNVFSIWAKSDPAAALAALPNLPPDAANGNLLPAINEQWARQDPAGAWAASLQIAAVAQRNVFQDTIVRALADSDPPAAFELFQKFSLGNQRLKTFTRIFQAWAAQKPGAAFDALLQLPAGQARTNGVQSVFATWAGMDPLAALQSAQAIPPGPDHDLAEMVGLRSLAAQNPQSAGEYIAALPPGPNRSNLVSTLTASWADSNPAAALAWLKSNAVGEAYDSTASAVLSQLVETHPQESLPYILELPAGAKRDNLLEVAAGKWALFDNQDSATWAKANLTGSDLAVALAGIAIETSYTDPAAAAVLARQLPSDAQRDDALTNIALRVGGMEPDVVVQWLQNLPNDMADGPRRMTYQNVVNKWAGVEPAAAAAYAQGLTQDPVLSPLASRVAATWAQSDGPAAMKWADALPAGTIRDKAISAAVANWAKSDPAAAAAALEMTGLSGDQRQELRTAIQNAADSSKK